MLSNFIKTAALRSKMSSFNNKKIILPKITLTERENEICNLLNDYANQYNTLNKPIEPLILRITGGWVRDKLLGQGSHDLDIAINIMTGEQFALGLNKFLTINFNKYGIKPHSIHKIDKNPEKSKHLETATTKLFGIEIDFVNLRSEEYTELSRIPNVDFGTPLQDALRRDATLNALFYNIHEKEIEDFTQRGLNDLQDGIIRTPLPPKQTFLDDPLRVIRLIRFASRFNFKIADDVMNEMADKEINIAFNSKISRERVGNEMEKILNGPNPNIALHLIQKANLENVIFLWHNDKNLIKFNQENLENYNKIDEIYKNKILNNHLLKFWNQHTIFLEQNPSFKKIINENSNIKQNFILGTALLPMSKFRIIGIQRKKVNNTMSLTESIIREGLKMSKSDAILVGKCVDSIDEYRKNVTILNEQKKNLKRSNLGSFIRTFDGKYKLAHYISLMNDYLMEVDAQKQKILVENYNNFFNFIINEGLENCHTLKPLIDGKRLLKLLNLKAGPWMGQVNDEIILWQLENPNGDEEELLKYIKDIIPNYLK